MKTLYNGQIIDMTTEELALRENDIASDLVRKQQEQSKIAQKEQDALDGNNKLLELGLTQSQVTAMTGYVPPSIQYQNLIDKGLTQAEATALTGYTPPVAE